ncbi:unnamed protein product [Pieris brassicae]|uniref:Uncharacterized protein n=1 Tax=Pieris brassicae TaxID=7116 RepID=A0A9P0XGK5_PIEBR|nr:unnamed protein product [Pieris brassicae]
MRTRYCCDFVTDTDPNLGGFTCVSSKLGSDACVELGAGVCDVLGPAAYVDLGPGACVELGPGIELGPGAEV